MVFCPACLLVPLLWSGLLTVLANLSGWSRLSQTFPDHTQDKQPIEWIHYSSGKFNGIGVNGGLSVGIQPEALHLKVKFPVFDWFIRPFMRAMAIPWHAIQATGTGSLFGIPYNEYRIERCQVTLRLLASLQSKLEAYLPHPQQTNHAE